MVQRHESNSGAVRAKADRADRISADRAVFAELSDRAQKVHSGVRLGTVSASARLDRARRVENPESLTSVPAFQAVAA